MLENRFDKIRPQQTSLCPGFGMLRHPIFPNPLKPRAGPLPEIGSVFLHPHPFAPASKVNCIIALEVLESMFSRDVDFFCDENLSQELGSSGHHGTPKDWDTGTDARRCCLESGHDNRDGAVPGRVECRVRRSLVLNGSCKSPNREDVDT